MLVLWCVQSDKSALALKVIDWLKAARVTYLASKITPDFSRSSQEQACSFSSEW